MSFLRHTHLPRLPAEWYRGRAAVLWTHTMRDRATGWLDREFHHAFREVMLHAGARYSLHCPCYVLMPDHWHLVWLGGAASSDQRDATRFLRRHLAPYLGGARLQDQAHDHVLRSHERERGAFGATCLYVRQNPVRAGLSAHWTEWPYGGAVMVGYPDLRIEEDSFWDRFWRIYDSTSRVAEGVLESRL